MWKAEPAGDKFRYLAKEISKESIDGYILDSSGFGGRPGSLENDKMRANILTEIQSWTKNLKKVMTQIQDLHCSAVAWRYHQKQSQVNFKRSTWLAI